MNIVIDDTNVSLELLESQKYKNMEVIPVKLNSCSNKDYLTLKRGIRAGFVEITECEVSTVGTVLARNNSNIPLILIDGDEIVGAKQNRIMNRSLIIPPNSSMHVSVSCTEQGRWHYGRQRRIFDDIDNIPRENFRDNINVYSEDFEELGGEEHFDCSDFAADLNTRIDKSYNLFEDRNCQSGVWSSISDLERKTAFRSRTSALNDNYENHRVIHNEFLKHFKMDFGQSGAIFIINGQIKGFELFCNPSVYQDYHEKIFRSYIMEAMINDSSCYSPNISFYELEAFLREISKAEFRHSRSKGIGRHMNFANKYGTGSVLIDGRNLVHINYFNTSNPKVSQRRSRNYGTFRDFVDDI